MTNLQSVDNSCESGRCDCSTKHMDDVGGLTDGAGVDSYQFHRTFTGVTLYTVSDIHRSEHMNSAQYDVLQPSASASYSLLIGKLSYFTLWKVIWWKLGILISFRVILSKLYVGK